MEQNNESVIKHRTYFFYDCDGHLIIIGILITGIIAALIGLMLIQTLIVPPPIIFKTSANLQLVQEPTLQDKYISENALLNWITELVINGYSFNFVNYPQSFSKMESYFTEAGYQSYLNSIQNNELLGQLDEVIKGRYVLKATPTAAPTIKDEGIVEDVKLGTFYSWKITININLQYKNSTNAKNIPTLVTLIAVRAPTLTSPLGVKINKFSAEPLNRSTSKIK